MLIEHLQSRSSYWAWWAVTKAEPVPARRETSARRVWLASWWSWPMLPAQAQDVGWAGGQRIAPLEHGLCDLASSTVMRRAAPDCILLESSQLRSFLVPSGCWADTNGHGANHRVRGHPVSSCDAAVVHSDMRYALFASRCATNASRSESLYRTTRSFSRTNLGPSRKAKKLELSTTE